MTTDNGVNIHPEDAIFTIGSRRRLQAGTLTGTRRSDAQRTLYHITLYLQI
jgi:hypothetical protein